MTSNTIKNTVSKTIELTPSRIADWQVIPKTSVMLKSQKPCANIMLEATDHHAQRPHQRLQHFTKNENVVRLTHSNLFKQAVLIDNTWQDAKSGESIDVFNPFNDEKIGTVPNLSVDEVTAAICSAKQAQKAWAAKTAHGRGVVLNRWAELIDEHIEDLSIIMTIEQGKPLKESTNEIHYASSLIRWFAEEGKRIYGDTIAAKDKNLRHIILKEPIGVCCHHALELSIGNDGS